MIANRIKEQIRGLSFDEMLDIANYIDETIKEVWQNELSISQKEQALLDNRLEQADNKNTIRYNLSELSDGIKAIKHQKKVEEELSITLSKEEALELDRRLLLIEQGETRTIPFKQAFNDLKLWANTK